MSSSDTCLIDQSPDITQRNQALLKVEEVLKSNDVDAQKITVTKLKMECPDVRWMHHIWPRSPVQMTVFVLLSALLSCIFRILSVMMSVTICVAVRNRFTICYAGRGVCHRVRWGRCWMQAKNAFPPLTHSKPGQDSGACIAAAAAAADWITVPQTLPCIKDMGRTPHWFSEHGSTVTCGLRLGSVYACLFFNIACIWWL